MSRTPTYKRTTFIIRTLKYYRSRVLFFRKDVTQKMYASENVHNKVLGLVESNNYLEERGATVKNCTLYICKKIEDKRTWMWANFASESRLIFNFVLGPRKTVLKIRLKKYYTYLMIMEANPRFLELREKNEVKNSNRAETEALFDRAKKVEMR